MEGKAQHPGTGADRRGCLYQDKTVKQYFYYGKKKQARTIQQITQYLDENMTWDKTYEIMESIMKLDKRREQITGEAINFDGWDIVDKMLWIVRESYRLGACYGATIIMGASNKAYKEMESAKAH